MPFLWNSKNYAVFEVRKQLLPYKRKSIEKEEKYAIMKNNLGPQTLVNGHDSRAKIAVFRAFEPGLL